jgi:uncharacterized protein
VVDDSFLQPNPGTSAGAHLPGGLDLALLVVAGVLYERLRAGARAVMALLAGFFGVLAGTEAVYYTSQVGPSGDDYTGLLSLPAGPVLLRLAAVTLWRSRRTGADVDFTTSDGLRLEGWYVRSRNGAAVISFPGRADSQEQAKMLARHGYGGLLFDRRGEGESSATRTCSAGTGSATCTPPSRSCSAGPTSTRRGSAGSACRSAAR